METFLVILSFLLAVIGILGVIYPLIPGALVSYGSLVLFYFATDDKLSLTALIIWGIIVAIASVADSVIAPLITKRMGGSKRAATGSLIGVLVGSFFIPPFGMLFGAFFGALLGEWSITHSLNKQAMRAAIGSFLGFILGTGIKLIVSIMILIALIIHL